MLECGQCEWSCSCRRPARSSPTSLIITSTACSTIPAHNRWSTHISFRCITPLELIAIWHPISLNLCPSSVSVLKHSFFVKSFPNIVLWLYCAFVDFVIVLLFQPRKKNLDWHWQWTKFWTLKCYTAQAGSSRFWDHERQNYAGL